MPASYHPAQPLLTFHDHVEAFRAGSDTPRAYLERCIETIEAREPVVKAWAALRIEGARADADAAGARYAAGRPLSLIDGMPIGVKDLFTSKDLPTGLGVKGNENGGARQDSSCIQAIRDAGAVFVGKLTTTELGHGWPSPTTNPFDQSRTPGGSSAGSGAAVGAAMVPAAIGSQVGGSLIRPAAYCGNFGIKPTFGAIHRGERQFSSQSCTGVHAGSLTDMWRVAAEIVSRIGGDPGHPGLYGDLIEPDAIKPARLIVMETETWKRVEPATLSAFEAVVDQLQARGVTVLRRQDDPAIEAFEAALRSTNEAFFGIVSHENRPSWRHLIETMSENLSPMSKAAYENGKRVTVPLYRRALALRDEMRLRHQALAGLADALISPAVPAPAPTIVPGDASPSPTGDAGFNTPTSILGSPALTVPLMSVGGMPVGVQLVGQWHADERLTAYGRWLWENLEPVIA